MNAVGIEFPAAVAKGPSCLLKEGPYHLLALGIGHWAPGTGQVAAVWCGPASCLQRASFSKGISGQFVPTSDHGKVHPSGLVH